MGAEMTPPKKPQPTCYEVAPTSYELARLRRALRDVGVTSDIFGEHGPMYRNPHYVQLRERVWWHMRQPDQNTGQVLSYPRIAALTTKNGHATIYAGIQRHERRLRRKAKDLKVWDD